MGTTTNVYYGTQEEVYEAYNALPDDVETVKEMVRSVGTDGKVNVNGVLVDLPTLVQAAFQKFGMAFARDLMAYYAGYQNLNFSLTLQTFLHTDTMIKVMAGLVTDNRLTLESVDPDLYRQGLISAAAANPKVFKEAYFYQMWNKQNMGPYGGLLNQMAWSSIAEDGKLRNPFKKGGPQISMALLLFLAQNGMIGLLMLILYRQQNDMASKMQWQLTGVIKKQNDLKREIMKKIAGLSKAQDDPMVVTQLQQLNAAFSQVKSAEELTTGMINQVQENLNALWKLIQRLLETENQMNLAAARG